MEGRLQKEENLLCEKEFETMHSIVFTKTLGADSLGAIIGQFKSICTKRIRTETQINFAWQPRFYDRIIRSENELNNIRRYICNNPIRWSVEKEEKENIFE